MKVLAIDESGKGPVLGPLVICGYMIDSKDKNKLKKLNVKDSKLLTSKKREELAPELRKIAKDHVILKIDAKDIDKNKKTSNLNKLEIAKMQEIINTLKPDKVIIDAFEVNTRAFKQKIRAGLKNKNIKLICENFADKNHVEVSAASVLAKVCRDECIAKLQEKHGFNGSGYPSDERTIMFLKDWLEKNNELPDFVRKSWYTSKALVAAKEQKTLTGFLNEFCKDD